MSSMPFGQGAAAGCPYSLSICFLVLSLVLDVLTPWDLPREWCATAELLWLPLYSSGEQHG